MFITKKNVCGQIMELSINLIHNNQNKFINCGLIIALFPESFRSDILTMSKFR